MIRTTNFFMWLLTQPEGGRLTSDSYTFHFWYFHFWYSEYDVSSQQCGIKTMSSLSGSVFLYFPLQTVRLIILTILPLIQSQLLSLSFSIPLSAFLPSSPHPPPPCHQSGGTGSIVIGLQSWQPYDWAVGYYNWIRLEISSVPVRLLSLNP